ncbi:hypothetical protein ABZX88_21170 [Kitasatospora aureofaciens]|uniref:hypothetical protein n=1 Tax=Kitasatospora aureofaciens TaxID=1894 RepID=UPI0005260A4C|nr:hypothetical protein [Kitasatospora aureofaciens]HJD83806.1 hypothetical protein [Kitasatospora aureofaciens]
MTTQGERTPTPGEGQDGQAGQWTGGGAEGISAAGTSADGTERSRRGRRLTGRRAVGWVVMVGVVAAGGWIITRPMPGDYIPGLGPSTKDSARTPPVVGNPPPTTDPEALNAGNLFPAQRPVEVAGYKARRGGIRQGEKCDEVLQDRTQELLKDSGCQAYLIVSFTGVDHPVRSSVTLLRFADQAAAARAADTLRGKPGAVAFILADTNFAAAPSAGSAKPGSEARVEAVGHYVTVTSSRPGDARPADTASSNPAPSTPTPTASGGEPNLDEATRALSYAAGQPFVWM